MITWIHRILTQYGWCEQPKKPCECHDEACAEEERQQAAERDREHRQRRQWMRDQAELLARVQREREEH